MEWAVFFVLISLSCAVIFFLLFNWFKKDKSKPVYKMVSYWFAIIFTSVAVFFLAIFIFLDSIFGSTDCTDFDIKYGKEIILGEDDGLMYTDWVKFYDNNTFHIFSRQIEANGVYRLSNDTIQLEYNADCDVTILPKVFVLDKVSLQGYSIINNTIDTTSFFYFSRYNVLDSLFNSKVKVDEDLVSDSILEPIIEKDSKRKLKYLFFSNGGLLGYFNDGTVSGCSKCDVLKSNIEMLSEIEPHLNYTVSNTGELILAGDLEGMIPIEINKDGVQEWAIIDYKEIITIK